MSSKNRRRSASRNRGPKWPSFRHHDHVSNLISGQTRFAWHLYKAIRNHPNVHSSLNVCFSPILVHQALTMSFIGARYESAELLKSLLQIDKMENDASINLAYADITRSLAYSASTTEEEELQLNEADKRQYTLYSAVRLYLPITHCLLDQYGAALSSYYASDMAKVPFHTDKERARQEINQWIEEVTQQKIKTLLPPLSLPTFVSMVLASALYFKPNWPKKLLTTGTMTLIDFEGVEEVLAFQFSGQFRHGTIDEADCRLVELPFAEERYKLVLILPNQTGSDVLEALDGKLNENLISRLDDYLQPSKTKLKITFPQFDISESLPIGKVLQNDANLGKVFVRGKANFSGISGNNNLHLSHIEHKVRFELDEFKKKKLQLKQKRATTNKAEQKQPINKKMDKSRMDFDRPFIFAIRDSQIFNSFLVFGCVRKLPSYNPDLINGNEEKTKACTC